jgi:hypothetical protein
MMKAIALIGIVTIVCGASIVSAHQTGTSNGSIQSATSTQPAALNIAFDQVDRTLRGSATPPPLRDFAYEVQWAEDEQNSNGMPSYKPPSVGEMVESSIPFVGNAAIKKEQAEAQRESDEMMDQTSGIPPAVLTRYAFYNGWTRVETANSIIIRKPDQHLTIFIDPKTKTYRIFHSSSAMQSTQSSSDGETSSGGSADAKSIISMGAAAGETVDGQQLAGYSTEAIVTLSNSQGSCHDGTFRAKQLVYFAQMPEPLRLPKEKPIDTLALPEGCSAVIQRETSGAPAPAGPMYVYKLITVIRDPNSAVNQGSSNAMPDMSAVMGGSHQTPANYMKLSQRGNIRTLTAADESLFEVPAGYTQDQ